MVMKAPTLEHRIHARRCVACGYDGDLLHGGLAERCARCGCDLRERPARSYAEMEGFATDVHCVEGIEREEAGRAGVERWLAFSILIGACVLAIAYFAAAMTP